MAFNPLNPNGQATMTNSQPVVIASDQSVVPVSASSLPLPSGASTSAKQDTGNTSVASIDTKTPALGQALAAASVPVVLTAAQVTALTPLPAIVDLAPATQNVTVIDSGSSTATGANNQSIVIGTPTVGSAASFTLATIETIRVEVTGIWTGTLTAETSIDGGTTWTSQGLHQGAYTTSSFTAGFIGGGNVAGTTNFRMRATGAITGTAVVKVIESINTQSVYIANAAPSGTVVSVLNSTTATLTSGSVYTGTWEDVTNFSEMRISVISDVASATNGLSIQQSSNGTNADITDTYTIAAASGSTFVVPRQAKFFRVVYTNGGTNQTSFRLQVILNRTATAPSSQRPADAQTNETDLVQNQTFLMGYNGSTWDRLRTVGTGILSVSGVLTAGSAIIGKIGIDQTTPGTTNLVALAANQTINVAQINGATPLMGNGVTGTGSQRVTIASDQTAFSVNATLSAETTKVIGTVNIAASQTIAVTNTGTFAVQATPVTQADTFMLGGVNIKEINAVTPLMGNGVTGTGSLRVTIASDNTAFSVNATLSAETTKVIGVVRNADGAGNLWTSNSTTYTAKFGQDVNLLGTLGTAFSTAGKVDIKGADGDVFVRQATGTNLHVVTDSGTITTVSTVTNLSQMNGVAITMGNGVSGTGVQRVSLASDSTGNIATIGTSVTPGTAAANLGKAEDAAHASGDTGVFALGVRNDNLATTYTSTDQDYSPFAVDLNGRTMVAQKAATATLTNVAGSATSVTVLAANASRIGATITNDSSAVVYIKFGTTASTTSYTVVLAGAAAAPFSYFEVPSGYTGRIDGIWASATGNARVTEIT